ncbi:lambda repressor-like predicted transcriptional regulator [Caldalkalibacillus uzonensis]|uniref:Lambda repressor-like predicted transcriptional regulator n=1 Tax=Caldalkalibacillus uzonensis TaxID=353224 RepID=A0ABU0CXE3_9BACI|nr:helix-turn-helix transcriptional regulator [Caldalkalibacillus uzonensis]MDQ0340801.1 lambda repressor-like predicted transcriptional regulator [Caldalkalibacillus uzonensis]
MGTKIKELLNGRPITWLFKKTGIHRNTIKSYIDGKIPTLKNADLIADAFGVTVYEVCPKLISVQYLQEK